MKKLLILCLSIWTPVTYAQNNLPCLAADIIFLTDRSFSMMGAEQLVGDAVSVLVEGIVPEDTRIQFGIISFGGIAQVEIPLTSDYPKLLLSIEEYKKKNANGSNTYIVPGINLARKVFSESSNENNPLKIIIVLSDGEVFDEYGLGEFTDLLSKKENIIFFALGFGPENDIPDISDPILRMRFVSFMSINDSLLTRISNGKYYRNNSLMLRDTIRKLGACL